MKNNQSDNSLPKMLTDNFQKMTNVSLEAMQPLVENMVENMANFNRNISESGLPTLNIFGTGKKSKCCPPEETCLPHCIASIYRQAMAGERIIVPFLITNNCNTQKTYRLGLRELKDADGNLAPTQPALNKNSVSLEPGRSERVLMMLDLSNYSNGTTYEAEIVIREKEINQNVCFTLNVNDHNQINVTPYNENKYKLKWQSWQSHFYCEPQTHKIKDNVRPLKNVYNQKDERTEG
ncbi:hypothetical protein K8089_15085 [Aequorivita sp. F47161]|uniref:Uncharacterized protein n=1 Tax=Aequorivita vitellina TaxID=2874475 RepID=A0A9X1U486_9FLAO|nr:hypothetical protein [Aequorivita vitellina]MCG2420348.1 hypothetical protein [Aequorivita vitellina]